MKKIIISAYRKTKEYISNPHANLSLHEKYKRSGCVSHDKDTFIKDLGNGYPKIIRKRNG